jgi:hypothetical protein
MMALCRVFSGVLKRDSNLYLMSGRYDPVIGMGMDNVSGVKCVCVCVCGVVWYGVVCFVVMYMLYSDMTHYDMFYRIIIHFILFIIYVNVLCIILKLFYIFHHFALY